MIRVARVRSLRRPCTRSAALRAVPLALALAAGASADTITTFAGTGMNGNSGDGASATLAQLSKPADVVLAPNGNAYISDAGNKRVRIVYPLTGIINAYAGTGQGGFSGDGGPATGAKLSKKMNGVATDIAGNLYIAGGDNHRVRWVDASTGIINTLAGNGQGGFAGDGGPATSAKLKIVVDVAVDRLGNVFIADQGNIRIRRVAAATGVISTVVGTGASGYTGDGGAATAATLSKTVSGLAVDDDGHLYIADTGNSCIRRVDATTGVITTVAGNGNAGFSGDAGLATLAQLNKPEGVAVDGDGNLFIADTKNHRVRRVWATSGLIATIAGNGFVGSGGDGGPATAASLNQPAGVTVAPDGSILVADTSNNKIRRIAVSSSRIVSWQEVKPD